MRVRTINVLQAHDEHTDEEMYQHEVALALLVEEFGLDTL